MALDLYQTGERGKAAVLNRPWQQFLALFGYQSDGSDFTGLDRAFFAAQRAQGIHWVTDPSEGAAAVVDDATDDRAAAQAKIDAAADGDLVHIPPGPGLYLASEPLYIDKPLRLRIDAPIRTGTWGVPAIIVDSVDVVFENKVRVRYTGARADISTAPTSTDPRVQAVYDEVAGDSARLLCAGIFTRRKVDRFTLPHINTYGLFTALCMANLSSATTYDSDAVSIGQVESDTVDWPVVLNGFKAATIGAIKARNVTNVTGDPSHAIYVSPRNAGVMNGSLTIGSIDVDGGATVANSDSYLNASDAFSIRSTTSWRIGSVSVRALQLIGNANNGGTGSVGFIYADLLEFKAGVTSEIYALMTQGGASFTVENCDITARPRCDGTLRTGVFQMSGTGSKLFVDRGNVRIATTANAGIVARATSGEKVDLRGVDIAYDAAISTTLAAADQWPVLLSGLSGRSELHLCGVKGTKRLVRFNAYDDHLVVLDPALCRDGIDADTVSSASGVSRITFANAHSRPFTSRGSAYTATRYDGVIYQSAAGGAVTVTLPPAADARWQTLTIKKTDATANVVTVDGNGAETIDGAATYALTAQHQAVTLHSNGSAWLVIGKVA